MRMRLVVGVIPVLMLNLVIAVPDIRPEVKAEADSTQGKWLHVRVEDGAGERAETVRVNVPLSLAQAVIPAINVDRLQGGKIKIEDKDMNINGMDMPKLLEALKSAQDGNYVTVEGNDSVQVAKQGGLFLVKVQEAKGKGARVNVTIPMALVEALFSGGQNEIDINAALQALGRHGDDMLVTVDDDESKVRIWVDSKNESE